MAARKKKASAKSKAKAKTTPELTTPELIAKKRDGHTLDDAEIQRFLRGFVEGSVADYQMSAMAMAIYFQGMTPRETATFTLGMRDSGTVLDLSSIPGIKVDKHSTGGVGDKVSLCLAPLVAACGVPVPMIAGRGLAHTGGTIDKLEAIPGFRTDGSSKKFASQVKKLGCAIFGQTGELAPADRRLYALRDVTGTIESVPLITGSILSKKLAEGIDALVMDIKVGRGAFMKTPEQARELARSIVRVGRIAGKKVSVLLTRMDAPLGEAVGNAIETREAIAVLHGEGPEDLVECTFALGAEMLRLGGVAKSTREGRKQMQAAVDDRSGLKKFARMVKAQGGDPRVAEEPDRLELAAKRRYVKAKATGVIQEVDALAIGWAGVDLGAGRTRADQPVDPAVGITVHARPGDKVTKGDRLATMHVHAGQDVKSARRRIEGAFRIGRRRFERPPLVIDTLR